MKPQELYEAGRLQDAVTAALEEVRQHPEDIGRRYFLCELLICTGNLERVDKQLDTLGSLDPKAMTVVALFRQLVRAEEARQQFWAEGRPPEVLAEMPPWMALLLKASIPCREGKLEEAATLLAEAETLRPRVTGTCDGQPFSDFRDIDDRLGGVFEVLTSTGKYYWIPADRVESVEFHPPRRLSDLVWRRASMVVRDGPDGEVYLPALYPGTSGEANDQLRLGRLTEWRGGDGQPLRGAGQRMYLVGEEDLSIMELKELTFTAPPDSPEKQGS
jgi:type VI secretion system protein ImpE